MDKKISYLPTKIASYAGFFVQAIVNNFLPILFIAMYNGKQGKKVKYLFYIYYPLHILILYLI